MRDSASLSQGLANEEKAKNRRRAGAINSTAVAIAASSRTAAKSG